jgi:hypothetical protein
VTRYDRDVDEPSIAADIEDLAVASAAQNKPE